MALFNGLFFLALGDIMLPISDHKKCGIYEIRFIGDKEDRVYVGSSKDVNEREWSYWNRLSRGKCHNKNIIKMIREFGQDNMRFLKVATCHEKIRHKVEQKIKDSYKKEQLLNIKDTCASPRKKGNVTQEFVHRVFNKSISGKTAKEIAKEEGLSRRYINDILQRRRGIYVEISAKMEEHVESRRDKFLNLNKINTILDLALSGTPRKQIAETLDISLASINNLLTSGNYQHLFDKKTKDKYEKYRKTLDKTPMVIEIFTRAASGEPTREIAEKMQVSLTTVRDILNRKVLSKIHVPPDLIFRANK